VFRATTSIVSYALIFNMEKLPGTIFVSTAMFGLFRYSINLLIGAIDYFVKCAGRKFIHSSSLAYILVMLLAIILTKTFGKFKIVNLYFCLKIITTQTCSELRQSLVPLCVVNCIW
jgi:hypothetical protein